MTPTLKPIVFHWEGQPELLEVAAADTVSKTRARTKDQTRDKYKGAERLNID